MADVYAATDDTLDRRVAIKILNERFAGDPEIRARFTREARIAARLSTEPNVITIFDVADVDGQPAIVMEFLPGGTLADRMSAARIPPALALAWLEQAGRALDAAHAAGVVHRDVKPANLMLGADGELRVTDFGIARIAGDVSLTSVGTILGTSGYMSPEQAVGGTATAASDRYGLAVVAFELLCGRRPYLAETFAAEAAAHATAPIPAATSFDRSLPPSIDAVLDRGAREGPGGALSVVRRARRKSQVGVRRERRHDDADSRNAARRPRPPPSPRPSRHRSRRSPRTAAIAAALGALALLGIVLAAVVGRGGDEALPPTTVVRTATVAGETQVRTVTVEAQPVTPPPSSTAAVAGHRSVLDERVSPQRPGVQAAQGRRCSRRAADSRACGRRAPGLRLRRPRRTRCTTSPWPGSRRATATASRSCSTAPSGSRATARDQGSRAPGRQGLQALERSAPDRIPAGAPYPEAWPFALLSSSSLFAASRSAPSRSCSASSTTEPSCRWRSSSTSTRVARRCTSTARSCVRSSRSGRRACAAAPMR